VTSPEKKGDFTHTLAQAPFFLTICNPDRIVQVDDLKAMLNIPFSSYEVVNLHI